MPIDTWKSCWGNLLGPQREFLHVCSFGRCGDHVGDHVGGGDGGGDGDVRPSKSQPSGVRHNSRRYVSARNSKNDS